MTTEEFEMFMVEAIKQNEQAQRELDEKGYFYDNDKTHKTYYVKHQTIYHTTKKENGEYEIGEQPGNIDLGVAILYEHQAMSENESNIRLWTDILPLFYVYHIFITKKQKKRKFFVYCTLFNYLA